LQPLEARIEQAELAPFGDEPALKHGPAGVYGQLAGRLGVDTCSDRDAAQVQDELGAGRVYRWQLPLTEDDGQLPAGDGHVSHGVPPLSLPLPFFFALPPPSGGWSSSAVIRASSMITHPPPGMMQTAVNGAVGSPVSSSRSASHAMASGCVTGTFRPSAMRIENGRNGRSSFARLSSSILTSHPPFACRPRPGPESIGRCPDSPAGVRRPSHTRPGSCP